jgi:hypothetical protein
MVWETYRLSPKFEARSVVVYIFFKRLKNMKKTAYQFKEKNTDLSLK